MDWTRNKKEEVSRRISSFPGQTTRPILVSFTEREVCKTASLGEQAEFDLSLGSEVGSDSIAWERGLRGVGQGKF